MNRAQPAHPSSVQASHPDFIQQPAAPLNEQLMQLNTRQRIHDTYSVPPVDFPRWVLSCLQLSGTERVLDVGAGNMRFAESLALPGKAGHTVSLDLAFSILAGSREDAAQAIVNADALALPFSSGAFDVVMANHMLYHVPDIDAAISEGKRVLAPDGVFVATTNSENTMEQYYVLLRRALIQRSRDLDILLPPPVHMAFSLENGSRFLRRHFYAVMRYDLPQTLEFYDADPVIEYLESLRGDYEPKLPRSLRWEDLVTEMRMQIEFVIDYLGVFAVQKLTGVLIASDSGGFIGPFARALAACRAAREAATSDPT